MRENPTKIRFRAWPWGAIWIFVAFGLGLVGLQYFYTMEIREFRKMEIKAIVQSLDTQVGSRGRISHYITLRLEDGSKYVLSNGLQDELLGVVRPGDSLFKRANESNIFIVNKRINVDVINQGPWKK